jgi:hypothetical protein
MIAEVDLGSSLTRASRNTDLFVRVPCMTPDRKGSVV